MWSQHIELMLLGIPSEFYISLLPSVFMNKLPQELQLSMSTTVCEYFYLLGFQLYRCPQKELSAILLYPPKDKLLVETNLHQQHYFLVALIQYCGCDCHIPLLVRAVSQIFLPAIKF